jgi:hypothetical protein
MDTFITLLDLEPSPFVGSSHASQPSWGGLVQLEMQCIEPSDSLPVDQDNISSYFGSFCVIS